MSAGTDEEDLEIELDTGIHPTAVIHRSAEIGENVLIGPYCVIGPKVVIGDGCQLTSHVAVEGPTTMGRGNRVYPFASIGQQTQDLKYGGEPTYLEIGDENVFRECVTVNRSTTPDTKTVVGSHGNFLAYSHIAHECIVGDHVIFSNNGTLAGHVEMGDFAILGGLTAVHQFCRIGKHAITGGCSKIVQDVPPYMIADGNPARIRGVNTVGMKRRDHSEEEVRAIKEVHRILFRKGLNLSDADAEMASLSEGNEAVEHIREFIRSSQRGIIH